jgi:hypothetical protein
MSNTDIHGAIAADPDIMPTDEDFWATARVVVPQHKPLENQDSFCGTK